MSNYSSFKIIDIEVLNKNSLLVNNQETIDLLQDLFISGQGEDPSTAYGGLRLSIYFPLYGLRLDERVNQTFDGVESTSSIDTNSLFKSKLVPISTIKNNLLVFFKSIKAKLKVKDQILQPGFVFNPALQNPFIDYNTLISIENYFTLSFDKISTHILNLNTQRMIPQNSEDFENHIVFDIVLNKDASSDLTFEYEENNSYILDSNDFSQLSEIFEINDSIEENIKLQDNLFLKIDAKDFSTRRSSVKTKSIKKILNDKFNKYSSKPQNITITGKELQKTISVFDDTNTIIFGENNQVHSSINAPIIDITSEESKYLNFKNLNSIGRENKYFDDRFVLENSHIYDLPHALDDTFIVQKNVSKSMFDNLITQKKDILDIQSFNDNSFDHEFAIDNDQVPPGWDSSTLDDSISEDYDFKDQKQIKITLDFSDDIDLHLMNTRFTFNKPVNSLQNFDHPSGTGAVFINFEDNADPQGPTNFNSFTAVNDDLKNTNYFNFILSNPASYSSHFMPTAYWDFSEGRWNYLEGLIVNEQSYFVQQQTDLGISQEITKYDLFGSKNFSKLRENYNAFNNILPNNKIINYENFSWLSYYSGGTSNDGELYLSTYLKSKKPILTTPSFRNSNEMLSESSFLNHNKSNLTQITSSYSFPHGSQWQPENNHILDMSKYISEDFLLEKIIIKGKYSMQAEMPVFKGNFANCYRNISENEEVNTSNGLFENYNYKDNHHSVISNNITFFILNERQNIDIDNKKLKKLSTQGYFLVPSHDDAQITSNNGNQFSSSEQFLYTTSYYDSGNLESPLLPGFGIFNIRQANDKSFYFPKFNFEEELLRDYEGDFLVYSRQFGIVENYESFLSNLDDSRWENIFDARIIPVEVLENNRFNNDDLNNLSYLSEGLLKAKSNCFVYLKNHNDYSIDYSLQEDFVDYFSYNEFKNLNSEHVYENYLSNSDYSVLSDQETAKTYTIHAKNINNVNTNTTRELVTYANLLVSSSWESFNIDENIVKNIDTHHITKLSNEEGLCINIKEPREFSIYANVKNKTFSGYSSESVYEIKSNFKTDRLGHLSYVNNIMEGSSLESAFNLDKTTNRIQNANRVNRNFSYFKSNSGKIINKNRSEENVIQCNYVLKPTDRLIFGVSSYANGEVMPTVSKLHDKIEIILVGREKNKQVNKTTNDQSDSFSSIVIGDDKSFSKREALASLKNKNFYDKEWENSLKSENLRSNLNKEILAYKSQSQTFSNVVKLQNKKTFESQSLIYKKDTIVPVVPEILIQGYGKQILDNNDAFDNLNLYKENKKISKIIISDSFTNEEIESLVNTSAIEPSFSKVYSNLIFDWHKTYPYSDERFSTIMNKASLMSDTSLSVISEVDFNDNQNILAIYYDINSYSIGGNYDLLDYDSNGLTRFKLENDINSNYLNEFSFTNKTLKNYLLPSSKPSNYQEASHIKNFNTFTSINTEFFDSFNEVDTLKDISGLSSRFLKNNSVYNALKHVYLNDYLSKKIEVNRDDIRGAFEEIDAAQLQTSKTQSFIENNRLIKYEKSSNQNDYFEVSEASMQYLNIDNSDFDFITSDKTIDITAKNNNSSWYLVLEITDEQTDAFINQLKINDDNEYNSNYYFNRNIAIDLAPSIKNPLDETTHVLYTDMPLYEDYFGENQVAVGFNILHRTCRLVQKSDDQERNKIIIPLYFWETKEVDGAYIKLNNLYNSSKTIDSTHPLYSESILQAYSLGYSSQFNQVILNGGFESKIDYFASTSEIGDNWWDSFLFQSDGDFRFGGYLRDTGGNWIGHLSNGQTVASKVPVLNTFENKYNVYQPFVSLEHRKVYTNLYTLWGAVRWMLNSPENVNTQGLVHNKVFHDYFRIIDTSVYPNTIPGSADTHDIDVDFNVVSQKVYPYASSTLTTPLSVNSLHQLSITSPNFYHPDMIAKLIWSSSIYNSPKRFYFKLSKTFNKNDEQRRPVFEIKNINYDGLKIDNKILKNKKYFSDFSSLNNKSSLIDQKNQLSIYNNDDNDNFTLNEKVYNSNIRLFKNNKYCATNYNMVYKVKLYNALKHGLNRILQSQQPVLKHYISEDSSVFHNLKNTIYPNYYTYYGIEPIAIENKNRLFKKNRYSYADLVFDSSINRYNNIKNLSEADRLKTGATTPINSSRLKNDVVVPYTNYQKNTMLSKLVNKKLRVYEDSLINSSTKSLVYNPGKTVGNLANKNIEEGDVRLEFAPYFEINLNDTCYHYDGKSISDYFDFTVPDPSDGFSLNQKIESQLVNYVNGGNEIKNYNLNVPYTHNKLVKSIPDRFVMEENFVQSDDLKIKNTGSPVFIFDIDEIKNEELYDSITQVDERSKLFFFGFKRKSIYKYPVEKIDRFKFGVENAAKETESVYFEQDNYGQFSDKIMGTLSYSRVYQNENQEYVVDYTINKKFFNIDNYIFESMPSTANYSETYNKDSYSRITTPFIETDTY